LFFQEIATLTNLYNLMEKRTFIGYLFGLLAMIMISFSPVEKQNFVLNDIPSAQTQAATQQKLLLVQFTARWCTPCQIMEQNTWTDPTLIAYMAENCVASKVDIENFNGMSFTHQYQVKSVPTILVFSANGEMLGRYENSISASHLIKYLERFNSTSNRTAEITEVASVYEETDQASNQTTFVAKNESEAPTLSRILTEYDEWKNGERSLLDKNGVYRSSYFEIPEASDPKPEAYTTEIVEKTHSKEEVLINTQQASNYDQTQFLKTKVKEQAAQPKQERDQQLVDLGFVYTVQLGAYNVKELAELNMVKTAKTLAKEVRMIEPQELHDQYFRLITGTFNSKEEARIYAANLKKRGVDGFVRMMPESQNATLSYGMR
jgi:thioredoxin-related protein/cell division septation protein DedD